MGMKLGGRPAAATTRAALLDAMHDVQQRLQDAGIRCVLDSRDLPVPGTYLAPPVLHYRFGRGIGADHRLVVAASNTDRERALVEMSDLLASVQDALSGRVVTATPTEVETADQTAFLVAYECTWTDRTEPTS